MKDTLGREFRTLPLPPLTPGRGHPLLLVPGANEAPLSTRVSTLRSFALHDSPTATHEVPPAPADRVYRAGVTQCREGLTPDSEGVRNSRTKGRDPPYKSRGGSGGRVYPQVWSVSLWNRFSGVKDLKIKDTGAKSLLQHGVSTSLCSHW